MDPSPRGRRPVSGGTRRFRPRDTRGSARDRAYRCTYEAENESGSPLARARVPARGRGGTRADNGGGTESGLARAKERRRRKYGGNLLGQLVPWHIGAAPQRHASRRAPSQRAAPLRRPPRRGYAATRLRASTPTRGLRRRDALRRR